MKVKLCTHCKKKKYISEFYRTKDGKYSVSSWCINCSNEYSRMNHKVWIEKPGKREKRAKNSLKLHLKRFYNLSVSQYYDLLKKQNNVCKLCKHLEKEHDRNGNIKRLSVDHNHKTGKVRGLLCSRCNSVMGRLDINDNWLKNVEKYLNEVEF